MRVSLLLFLVLGLAPLAPAVASGVAEAQALAQAQKLHLAKDPEWGRLRYAGKDGTSEVLTSAFFLSSNGRRSAEKELTATLRAWFEDTSEGDANPRCRFPARYLWLSSKLKLPSDTSFQCPGFEHWKAGRNLTTISVLMVAGYLGNPASTFGHTLLNLNEHESSEKTQLLDVSIGYGAVVPPNESGFRYVFEGLTGGYVAGFADQPYFSQDQMYSRSEFRDIWEYKLNLTDSQKELLVAHLWEISKQQFTYYFMSKNCAYRTAGLLGLATDQQLVDQSYVWYAPVELFFTLQRAQNGRGEKLVSRVGFIPSSQRVLYASIKDLSSRERRLVNVIVRDQAEESTRGLNALPFDRQEAVLDALLAYYDYEIIVNQKRDELSQVTVAKDRVLRARLQLSAGEPGSIIVPELPPPTESHPLRLLGTGVEVLDRKVGGTIRVTPYAQDLAADGGNEGRELLLFDTRVFASLHDWRLDSFDLIQVRSFNTQNSGIAGDSHPSWTLEMGADRIDGPLSALHANAQFGFGKSLAIGSAATVYAVLNADLHSGEGVVGLAPDVGVRTHWGSLAGSVDTSARYDVFEDRWHPQARLEGVLSISKTIGLALTVDTLGVGHTAGLSLHQYF